MDFANLVCKVNTPLCNECTLKNMCNFENKIEKIKRKTNKNRKINIFVNNEKKFN